MKKMMALLITIAVIASSANGVVAKSDTADMDFITHLSEMITQYSGADYFQTLSVTIGDTEINIDGEKVAIDDNGTSAYVENGRTMMPVRGIAEVIGAEVDYDEQTQTVMLESEDKSITLEIGKSEMKVNDETVSLLTAPEIKNDRTMLPVRDVAEALDCEVTWNQETETAVFTKPLQTKRVIAFSEEADTYNAISSFSGKGMTVMQFETIEDAQKAIQANEQNEIIAQPDYVRSISSLSWGTSDIGTKLYHEQTGNYGGQAVVAVIDTGIDYEHPFFSGRIVQGYDFYNNDNYCEDLRGHGTHVASTVLDVAEYNSNIKVMPVKVFGAENTTSSLLVAEAIEYAASQGVDVINLSLGGNFYSDVEDRAVQKAIKNNVAVIAAAGNEKLNLAATDYTPANIDGVISVSALTQNGTLADFSNYGNVDFVAPGVKINGAKAGGGYCTKSGTSMAAPHVAGAYALVCSIHQDKPVREITEALRQNTYKNTNNNSYYGAGLIRIANVEKKLSDWEVVKSTSANITENNAKISATITYSGLTPSKIGLCIGTKDEINPEVYSWDGTKINGKTDINCDLQKDAKVTLSPGTKYYYYYSVMQGGLSYVGPTYSFTTKEAENLAPIPPKPIEKTETGVVLIPDSYENLSIRTGPSTDYKILGHMNHTDKCKVYLDKTKNGWYYVEYNGIKGYAAGNFIYLPSETKTGTVNIPSSFENLYIRTGPSTNYKIVGFMLDGEQCTIFTDKTKNGWYYVEYHGIYGYAAGNYID